MRSRSNGDTCHCISESKLSFKPQRSDKIPVPRSIFIKLSSMAENKIMQKKNRTILQHFQKSNTSKIFNPKVFFIAQKMTTRELSLVPDSQIKSDLKWPLAPYLKEKSPIASSSDPCQTYLDCRWGSRYLLISSVEIFNALKNWKSAFIYSKILLFYYF